MIDEENVSGVLGDCAPDLLLDLLILQDEALCLGITFVQETLMHGPAL